MLRTMSLRVLASLAVLVGLVTFAGCAGDDPTSPATTDPPDKTCLLIDGIVYCK